MSELPESQLLRFTGPARLEKAVSTLRGILLGITADRVLRKSEIAALNSWVSEHEDLMHKAPIRSMIENIEMVLVQPDDAAEELHDLAWLADAFSHEGQRWEAITGNMQELHGLLHGIVADSQINQAELSKLKRWIDSHQELRGAWPYSEIESLILQVYADGKIDEKEHAGLLSFFGEFALRGDKRVVEPLVVGVEMSVGGICAVCPDVALPKNKYCFTGKSRRASRSDLHKIVSAHGGECSDRVVQTLNYLVVCSEGSRIWAYECYGRKVEDAVGLRKQGYSVQIIHENDFWDAVADLGGEVPR